jgi:elongation factor Ts
MTKISASDVNMLRKKTGAGLMDCKNALTEAQGDFEKATDLLRKKGQKVAEKRGERDAKEGYVVAKTTEDSKKGAIIILNCETDFVAKNEEFIGYANSILELTLSKDNTSLDSILGETVNGASVKDGITDLVGKIGEKIEISQLQTIESEQVVAYNHPGNRLASLVGLNIAKGEDGEAAGKDVAMQIAAMNPVALDRDGVDKTIIEREMEIGMEQARQEGKPEAIIEKIATGKLNKFYKENTLLNQEFIKDNKKTIKQYLSEVDGSLTITEFCRQSLS